MGPNVSLQCSLLLLLAGAWLCLTDSCNAAAALVLRLVQQTSKRCPSCQMATSKTEGCK